MAFGGLLVGERCAGQTPERLEIALGGGRDDVVGKRGAGRFLVPAGGLEPVTERLLVEGRLVAAGLVLLERPEATSPE